MERARIPWEDCGFVFIMLSRHSFAASADTDIKGLEECEQMVKAKNSLDDTVMAGTWNYGIMLLYHKYR